MRGVDLSPAYFCRFSVSPCERLETAGVEMPSISEGIVETWFIEGYGAVAGEPDGHRDLRR